MDRGNSCGSCDGNDYSINIVSELFACICGEQCHGILLLSVPAKFGLLYG